MINIKYSALIIPGYHKDNPDHKILGNIFREGDQVKLLVMYDSKGKVIAVEDYFE